MKNYEEMARYLLARREAYEQQQKRKKGEEKELYFVWQVVVCYYWVVLEFGEVAFGKKDVVTNSATDETDILEEKKHKESITKNQADKESQDLQEGNKRVEFTIHNKYSHVIMGVTLPKGWNYSFVGSTHEDIRKDNKCCCSDPTESVRTGCTCFSAEKDKESALICQNAFKGKGVQSESKDLEEYGISFWTEENPKMKIQYLYHKDRLLFCGTGVTIGKKTLDNGGVRLKAKSLMEEIDKDI